MDVPLRPHHFHFNWQLSLLVTLIRSFNYVTNHLAFTLWISDTKRVRFLRVSGFRASSIQNVFCPVMSCFFLEVQISVLSRTLDLILWDRWMFWRNDEFPEIVANPTLPNEILQCQDQFALPPVVCFLHWQHCKQSKLEIKGRFAHTSILNKNVLSWF